MGSPISEDYDYFEMEFDSLDAQNAAVANVKSTDWPLFYLQRPLNNIAAIKVLEVQIPFTYYVFNKNNNTFLMNLPTVAPNRLITIPVGNYDANGLATTLGSVLTAATPGTLTWTVTYSGASSAPALGTFKFNLNTTVVPANPTFIFGDSNDNGNFNPRIMLGFPPGVTGVNAAGPGETIVAPNVNLVTGPNYMYLNSRKIGPLCNLYLPASASNLGSGTLGPQMAKIPVNVQPQGVIYWSDPAPEQFFNIENLANFNEIDFYFTLGNSSNQVPLEFNGVPFSIKLAVLVNKVVANFSMTGASAEKVYKRMVPR